MSRRRIYLDYAATTPLDPRVKKAMEPFLLNTFGNPSSIHTEGLAAKKALDAARIAVARSLEVHADEIVFTSGGTEANNLAIHGVLNALADIRRLDPDTKPQMDADSLSAQISVDNLRSSAYSQRESAGERPHVVTTNIEHASVLEPLRELERQGRAAVTYVSVEPNGIVNPEKILAAIRPHTALVSVMYVNNEIGTIQPIAKIGKIIQSVKGQKSKVTGPTGTAYPLFHVDACQAPLYLRCVVNALGVDLMTLDGHKMYGPKGVGALYVRRPRALGERNGRVGTSLAPLLFGGGQERGLRSTTENVTGIVGFAESLSIAVRERSKESARLAKLRNRLYSNIPQNIGITGVAVNGSMREGERLPNNLNISLLGVDTELLTLQLDAAGISVSTKSSCLKDARESYVVKALGGTLERSYGTLRFTLGRSTVEKDMRDTARILRELLAAKH
ncbi:MAG: cysteine desulfurase [Parcubacteria group bacterium Greene0416_79]|nr:MAG: cysteine desulfurase [Parcubacteria group bacterium Greene0416_79]